MDMNEAIARLIESIVADYANWTGKSFKDGDTERGKDRIAKFADDISINVGKKYIKIIKDGSVWGFVVNTENDKNFKYGDILKAASWATPARNALRGNVFENYEIRWTGPNYL